jgi:hypothetical protein
VIVMAEPVAPAPLWKRVVAPILDYIMVFSVGGYLIGSATGSLEPAGFELYGWPAALLFALVVAYFYVGRRVAGGTLWDRFFGIGRPQPR